jgi:hypothetical protein
MNSFHLRWSHANSAPAWSASEVGRLLSSCAIPIIDHISQPGSSPTDRFVGGPLTYSRQEICHAEGLGLSETGIQIHDNIAIAEAPSAQPIANKAQQGKRRSARNRRREEYHEEPPHWDPSTDVACDIRASQDDDPDMTGSEFIALNLTIKQALEEYGDGTVESVTAELQQLLDKGVAHALRAHQITAAVLKSAIPLKMFTKAKLAADVSIDKIYGTRHYRVRKKTRPFTSNISPPAGTINPKAMDMAHDVRRRHTVYGDTVRRRPARRVPSRANHVHRLHLHPAAAHFHDNTSRGDKQDKRQVPIKHDSQRVQ